jgi:replication factor C small subunit
VLHDLFQEYFSINVEHVNATDSKDFIIQYKRKWYDVAEAESKRKGSGKPSLYFILKSLFRNFPQMRTFSEVPYRALIIQDADALTTDIQHGLRRTMEKSTRTCRFCLICENLSKIIDPIRSRCVIFHFTPLDEAESAAVLRYIISQENLNVTPEGLLAIIFLGKGNLRRTINLLQAVADVYPRQPIDADMVHKITDQFIKYISQQMLGYALDRKFMAARENLRDLFVKWGLTGEQITENIRDLSSKLAIPMDWKIEIANLLGYYELQMQRGSNAEIHLSAFLARLGTMNLD